MSKVIIDGQLAENSFTHLEDDAALPSSGDISVSWARWTAEAEQLKAHDGVVAPRLTGSDELINVVAQLQNLDVICLAFPAFADGRCYSFATRLRRAGFEGQLRAVGDVLRDQMFYMLRVGFNAFEVRADRSAEDALHAFKDFSVTYQAATDNPSPIYRRA